MEFEGPCLCYSVETYCIMSETLLSHLALDRTVVENKYVGNNSVRCHMRETRDRMIQEGGECEGG